MSTVENLVCYLEYDEGDMQIRIVDAVINMGIHSWGVPLNLSLGRDGADLLIVLNKPNTVLHADKSGDGSAAPAFTPPLSVTAPEDEQ